jgi:hypothetical protein
MNMPGFHAEASAQRNRTDAVGLVGNTALSQDQVTPALTCPPPYVPRLICMEEPYPHCVIACGPPERY